MSMTEAKLRIVARKLVDANPDLEACARMAEETKKEKEEAMGDGRGYAKFWDSVIDQSRGHLLNNVDSIVTMYSASEAPPDFTEKDLQMLHMFTVLEARRRAR